MSESINKCSKTPKEFNGICCCNCIHLKKLMKHPMNKEFGKGSILESCGYVCTVEFEDKSNKGNVIYSDTEHGLCELHYPKEP